MKLVALTKHTDYPTRSVAAKIDSHKFYFINDAYTSVYNTGLSPLLTSQLRMSYAVQTFYGQRTQLAITAAYARLITLTKGA